MIRKTMYKGIHKKVKFIHININIINLGTGVFKILVGNLTVLKRLKEAKRESKRYFL